jgi:hypothetical protein
VRLPLGAKDQTSNKQQASLDMPVMMGSRVV